MPFKKNKSPAAAQVRDEIQSSLIWIKVYTGCCEYKNSFSMKKAATRACVWATMKEFMLFWWDNSSGGRRGTSTDPLCNDGLAFHSRMTINLHPALSAVALSWVLPWRHPRRESLGQEQLVLCCMLRRRVLSAKTHPRFFSCLLNRLCSSASAFWPKLIKQPLRCRG